MTALLDDHDELSPDPGAPASQRRNGLHVASVVVRIVLPLDGPVGGALLLAFAGNVERAKERGAPPLVNCWDWQCDEQH